MKTFIYWYYEGESRVSFANVNVRSMFHQSRCISVSVSGFIFINSLRPRPNRRHFADDIFKCIFENENEWISPRISLKFVPKVRINNIPALVQIMAWRRPGDKPLSEPMMVSLLTHICVTRPQWVKHTKVPNTYNKDSTNNTKDRKQIK